MIITSAGNEKIKSVIQLKEKAKVRKKEGCYIVEGSKMVLEAPKQDIVQVYVSESFCKENPQMQKEYSPLVVADNIFKKISDTVTPQGVLAIVRQRHYSFEQLMETIREGRNCFVVLDSLRDPGNMGTIIRTGEGAGINGIIMNNTSVDVYNPKVIRSTMGSIFRVPIVVVEDLPDTIKKLRSEGVVTYAAHLKGGNYSREEFAEKTAILIGNEANGLSDEVAAEADKLIKIPMHGKVESLNAAVATSILMYQIMN